MKKTLVSLILLPMMAFSQEYQVLQADQWAYDVEVVIFGRQLAQADSLNINSRLSNLDVPTHELLTDISDLPLLKALPQENPVDGEQWQVPIEGEQPKQQALVWVLLQTSMNHPVVNKLLSNPTIKPLHYQKWRQPATRFLSPEYVAVTSIIKPEITYENDPDSPPPVENLTEYADFAFDGVVAYSKQKFDHVTVKMNYYRHDPFGQIISYAIDQKQRIKLDEWQYFDHQQFGIMVKVSAISSDQQNEVE